MHRRTRYNLAQQWALAVACMPLALLTGCPQEKASQAAAPGKVPAQATAPATNQPANANAAQAAQLATSQTVQDAAKAYKSQQLVNRVEQIYRSGVDNYRAGHRAVLAMDLNNVHRSEVTAAQDIAWALINSPAFLFNH